MPISSPRTAMRSPRANHTATFPQETELKRVRQQLRQTQQKTTDSADAVSATTSGALEQLQVELRERDETIDTLRKELRAQELREQQVRAMGGDADKQGVFTRVMVLCPLPVDVSLQLRTHVMLGIRRAN